MRCHLEHLDHLSARWMLVIIRYWNEFKNSRTDLYPWTKMKARISIAVTFCRSQFDNNRRLYHSNRCFNHILMVKPDKSGSINFDDKSIKYVPSTYTFFWLAKTTFYLPSLIMLMVSATKLIKIFFDICKASNFRAPLLQP